MVVAARSLKSGSAAEWAFRLLGFGSSNSVTIHGPSQGSELLMAEGVFLAEKRTVVKVCAKATTSRSSLKDKSQQCKDFRRRERNAIALAERLHNAVDKGLFAVADAAEA